MLNISHNSISGRVDKSKYKSFKKVGDMKASKVFTRLLLITLLFVIAFSFLPWTQNIRSKGYVTTLKPDQRPQNINSVIAGQIAQWYVQEGDFVKKGDTIINLTEVKEDYFDPKLLENTALQIDAKKQAASSYANKANALERQIDALSQTKKLKLEQANNYLKQTQLQVQSDSIALEAAETDYTIASRQLKREEQLYDKGLKSLTSLEAKRQKKQMTLSKKIGTENKYLVSKNKLINAKVELNSIENQYQNKLAKAQSDKFATLSSMYDANAVVSKMENTYTNYDIRRGFYYITAPQDGYITKAIKTGIGETLKEGDKLMTIMPFDHKLAVEMYVSPIDIPLLKKKQAVRFVFDGWPAIAFGGWPNMSFGTFGGEVVAIDNFMDKKGSYRILVAQTDEDPWPEALRLGSGATGMALLHDVPIWYEVWRRLNGFPADYYDDDVEKEEVKKIKIKVK